QPYRQAIAADPVLQLGLDAVEVEFAVLEEHQGQRPAGKNLPAQLGADRTAGAGDHHHLITNAALEQIPARRHRIAAEQVDDVHFLQVADADPAAGQVHEAGD